MGSRTPAQKTDINVTNINVSNMGESEEVVGMFVGRENELRLLDKILARATRADAKSGQALLIRGRRRVGKSRLVEQFLERAQVPYLFFAATGRPIRDELRLFADEAAQSSLPGAENFRGVELTSWDAAFRLLVTALPAEGPSVVVLDEIPCLMAEDDNLEGTLQRVFDRDLSRLPTLLIGIGSDLAMMEALNEYGRPFHQRARELVVPSLSPAEVRDLIGLEPAAAFDAYLITGGLPMICAEWQSGQSGADFLAEVVEDPTSAMLVSAERSLAAEFPTEAQARTVLSAIGSGERTFTNIGRAAGGIPQASLARSLELLQQKRLVVGDLPLSTTPPPGEALSHPRSLPAILAFVPRCTHRRDRARTRRPSAGEHSKWMADVAGESDRAGRPRCAGKAVPSCFRLGRRRSG